MEDKNKKGLIYKDYILEPEQDRFNLYENFTTIKEDGSKVVSQRLIGYSFRFQEALERIVTLEVNKRQDIVEIRHYIAEYKKLLLQITNILIP